MRNSITIKITCIIICLVAGTVLLCWLLNTTLMEGYYTLEKKNSLKSTFQMVNKLAGEGSMGSEDTNIKLETICSQGNITMIVMQPNGICQFTTVNDPEQLIEQFYDIIFAARNERTQVLDYMDDYRIGRSNDTRLNTEYLVLWGTMQDGNLVLMRTALEGIRESVVISNRLLAYVGILGIVVSAVISYFVTRRITNPILCLADISKRMTNLDFDAKFESSGKNEIDLLGEHMNQMSETLEKTISELKSANNELMLDLKKKNEIDEMRKEFLSNVSHELKTPLALIQGYAEGLSECINDDAQSREFYCEVIMDEADKMNRMVKQLLTLNQLEFGNESVSMERFDLTELISGVIQATSILREQGGSTVNFAENGPIYVWADEFKTEEVLTNFMSNAIHYAAGEKRIAISTEYKGNVVRISVFNTGSQIPEEDLEHIWIKFYKVDKARTREYGGSGIGLSIVKAIMESFHQECGVINREDGVEFWFELDCTKGRN